MEAIIFIGIQATGKSTFFQQRFFATHVRINLDMLKTRNRERILLAACLDARQPFVIDNTNLTRQWRAGYIGQAKDAGFSVTGYYFKSALQAALERNSRRSGKIFNSGKGNH
jgi:predicted kinase